MLAARRESFCLYLRVHELTGTMAVAAGRWTKACVGGMTKDSMTLPQRITHCELCYEAAPEVRDLQQYHWALMQY